MGEVEKPGLGRACGGMSSDDCMLGEAFESLPYILVLIDGQGFYRRVNAAAREEFGFDPTGLHRLEVSRRLDARLPDGRPLSPETMPSSAALGGTITDEFEYQITDAKGQTRWLLASIVPLMELDAIQGVLVLNKDITPRKNAEETTRKNQVRLRLLSETSGRLLAAADPKEVVRELCERVMEHLECQMFFSFKADEISGRLKLLAYSGIPPEQAAEIGWLDYGVAVCGCAARDRECIVAESIQERFDPRTELVRSFGVRAYCCHPLLGEGLETLGTLSFGTTTRDRFAPDEIEFMKAISALVAMALQRDREKWVLARSEARLKLFIEHAPASIAMLDRELRFISVSNRWREYYGLGSRDIVGMTHYALFPDLPVEWREAHAAALAGEVVKGDAAQVVAADGQKRLMRWEVRPWYGGSGGIGGIAIITEDVTREVADREALRESERLYHAIGESMDFGVWVCDPQGRNTYASESFLRMAGITQEECSNFGWGKCLHPDEEKATIAAWKERVEKGGLWDREHRVRGADGVWRDVLARGVQVKDEEGRVLCWAGINLDISGVKKAQRELGEALTRLDSHMMNTPLAVIEWDASFNIIRWAGAAERIFGWAAWEVLGRNIAEFDFVYPEDADSVVGVMEDMLSGKRPSNFNANRNFRRDGSVINCEWHNSSLMDDEGKLQSVLSLALDVTRRDLLTEELVTAKEAAEAANAAKSEFLARMSHELRTPLNGINGMIELALRQGLTGKARDYLALARQSSNGLLHIINDLLDISRIEAGRLELEVAPFRPAALLEYLGSTYGAQAASKGLTLRLEVSPEIPRLVAGDEGHLRQVLVNLLGNALKFTAHGRITMAAALSRVPADPGRVRLEFTVSDTGIGIEPGQLATLFESFSPATRLTHAQYGGTGLGLSISRQLIALLGGEVSVESRVGVGTTFTFTALFDEAEEEEAGEPEAALPRRPRGELRILLVEDNTTNRIFAQAVIEEQGHRVVTAMDGVEALSALEKTGVDLIMTDIQMPRLDGLELTRRVRAGDARNTPRDIPIIAMTAHAFAEDKERFMAAGMNDYITKPIDLDKLDLVLGMWSDSLNTEGAPAPAPKVPRSPGLERVEKRLTELFKRLPAAKVWELLDLAMEQMEPAMERLDRFIETRDAGELAEEVHRLRGTWTVVLGSERMLQIAQSLEMMARERELEGAACLVDELRSEIAGVAELIDAERLRKPG